MGTKQPKEQKQRSQKTPTFLLELPLVMNAGQAKRIRGHLEAGRQFYNALLSEGQRRLRRMQADPAWQEARAIPRTHKQERRAALSPLRGWHSVFYYPLYPRPPRPPGAWPRGRQVAQLGHTPTPRPPP